MISLSQQGDFGTAVEISAKIDSKLNTKTLQFFAYDKATNRYTQITAPNYWVDQNGYVHFTTTLAGDVVISDKPLAKK